MRKMRHLTFRTSAATDKCIESCDVVAEQLGLEPRRYYELLLHRVVDQILAGEIGRGDIEAHTVSAKDSLQRMTLRPELAAGIERAADHLGVGLSAVLRFTYHAEAGLRLRIKREEDYRTSGEPGDPSMLSDRFLALWHTHRDGKEVTTDTVIFMAIKPLEIRMANLTERVIRLERLLESERQRVEKELTPPTRSAINHMGLTELRELARRWKFVIPKKSTHARARLIALSHFGYAAE